MNPGVVITGASGGIGQALCQRFLDNGYHVVATSQRARDLDTSNLEFIPAKLDSLTKDEDQLLDFKNKVIRAMSGNPFVALVNNAATQILGRTEDLTCDHLIESFRVNTLAPFALTKAFLGELESANGSVVNIGSVHASATKPEFAAYSTSKSALHGLTRALAVDLGGRIRVNTIAPAATRTPMLLAGFEGREKAFENLERFHPIKRIAEPREVGDLAVFLCSDQAQFVTGATFVLDGGILSRLHDPV